jgi:hypothetical protein
MSLRPITPDELKHRVRDWANAVSGSMPLTIPVFHIGPNGRSFFNARDFSQQHGSAVVFGWTIFPEQTVLRAHFYAVVRLNGETFSVTHGNGDSMTFFEDRRNQPRLVHANGAELLHTFHSLVFPEVRPTRQIIVVDPEISESSSNAASLRDEAACAATADTSTGACRYPSEPPDIEAPQALN